MSLPVLQDHSNYIWCMTTPTMNADQNLLDDPLDIDNAGTKRCKLLKEPLSEVYESTISTNDIILQSQ